MKKVLFTATVDSHILHFHIPFLKLFKDNGYEVHVATNGNETIPHCDVKHVISFERSPFKLNNIKAIKELKKICDKEKFDIIHCHTPMGSVVTRLAAKHSRKKYNTRVIYTAHGFHFYKGAPIINWLLFYPVEKYLAKYTDTLITINKEDYNLAKKKFSRRCNNIEYVPGVGIDENKFNFKMTKKDKSALRKELGLKDDDFVLINVARLDKNKNQGFLIDAMKELVKEHSNIHLLLVGPDEYNGKYQKQAEDIKENVHFLGYRSDIPKLLKISDVAVSSSIREGLPVNIMEAMAAGLPIVALDTRGVRDLVSDGENGYVVEDNKLFINKIKVLYNNKNLINRVSKNNNSSFSNYSLTIINERMKNIYFKKPIVLIIPNCTDLNRGDQCLVLETKKIINKLLPNNVTYMMSAGDTTQCEKFGIKSFGDILKHPSRFSKNKTNTKYNLSLKIKWGSVSIVDYIVSFLLLYKITRKIITPFISKDTQQSLKLFSDADYVFVKGGGFIHNYTNGITGIYTIYYHLFHIKLALKMNKVVFFMPNSFGPFKNKLTSKMVNNVLKDCKLVTARESISASSISNGLGRDIDLYPDLAFFLKDNKSTLNLKDLMLNNKIDLNNDKIVSITVRPYRFYSYPNPSLKYMEYKKTFVNFINYLVKKNYKVFLVVHTRAENDHENDEKCIDEIISMLNNRNNVIKIKDDNLDCFDLKKIYGCSKYLVGTRFHSVVFSLEQMIPCIAVTYGGNKGDGIMNDIGLSEYSIKIGDLNSENLISTFEKMQKNEANIKEKISIYLGKAQKKYKELIKRIKELL